MASKFYVGESDSSDEEIELIDIASSPERLFDEDSDEEFDNEDNHDGDDEAEDDDDIEEEEEEEEMADERDSGEGENEDVEVVEDEEDGEINVDECEEEEEINVEDDDEEIDVVGVDDNNDNENGSGSSESSSDAEEKAAMDSIMKKFVSNNEFFRKAERAIANDVALAQRNELSDFDFKATETESESDGGRDLPSLSESETAAMEAERDRAGPSRHFYVPAKRVKRSGKLVLKSPKRRSARKSAKAKAAEMFRKKICRAVPPNTRNEILVYGIPTAEMKTSDLRKMFTRFGMIKHIEVSWGDTVEKQGHGHGTHNFAYIEYRTHWSAKMACTEMHEKAVTPNHRLKVWRLFDFE